MIRSIHAFYRFLTSPSSGHPTVPAHICRKSFLSACLSPVMRGIEINQAEGQFYCFGRNNFNRERRKSLFFAERVLNFRGSIRGNLVLKITLNYANYLVLHKLA